MLPFFDLEPIRRHETTVEITIDPGADPDAVRTDLLERAAASVGAALGPASPDRMIVAVVEVTLSIRFGALHEAIETVLPIVIRFDARDDHGPDTAGQRPDALLAAVIQNEVDRCWCRFGFDDFVSAAFCARESVLRIARFGRNSPVGRWRDLDPAEVALHHVGLSPCGIVKPWRETRTG